VIHRVIDCSNKVFLKKNRTKRKQHSIHFVSEGVSGPVWREAELPIVRSSNEAIYFYWSKHGAAWLFSVACQHTVGSVTV